MPVIGVDDGVVVGPLVIDGNTRVAAARAIITAEAADDKARKQPDLLTAATDDNK